MAITFDKAFGIHQYTMEARSRRAEVLAENIANADTPGYQARDINFSAVLEQAKNHQSSSMGLTRTNENHVVGHSSSDVGLMYRMPGQTDTGDGNSVDVNRERTSYMQNSIEFQASLEFLNSRISGLMKAIKGDSA